jgi:pimeloyl-CoA synthetase
MTKTYNTVSKVQMRENEEEGIDITDQYRNNAYRIIMKLILGRQAVIISVSWGKREEMESSHTFLEQG